MGEMQSTWRPDPDRPQRLMTLLMDRLSISNELMPVNETFAPDKRVSTANAWVVRENPDYPRKTLDG